MQAMTKITLFTASILSLGTLTACQSNTVSKENSNTQMLEKHKPHHKMSPEQREQFKHMRQERKAFRQQAKSVCDGKAVNQAVQIKVAEKTLDGTCKMLFKADHQAMQKIKADIRHDRHMKDMTEPQRAQIQQERAQKRIQRQAQWDAIQKSCMGQRHGQAIQVKIKDQLISGQCLIEFKPNQPFNALPPAQPSKI